VLLTPESITQYAPHAHEAYVAGLTQGADELSRAGIDTPLRICHFLAQTAHETGGFMIGRENTRWTPEQMCKLWPTRFKSPKDPRILFCRGNERALANLAYAGRKDLGNEGDDDGWEFRGGGFLQLTGRAAYREAGRAIGVDLENDPELILDPAVALKAALWVWGKHNLNQFADRNYGRAVGNAINRGYPYSSHEPIGFKSREQWLVRAWAMFGDGPLPDPSDLGLGAYGPRVGDLQNRLRDLGYPVGAVDRVYGPALARAVAAFKADYSREHRVNFPDGPGDLVSQSTWEALTRARPVEVSPERASATPDDLVALGSTEAAAGKQQMVAGKLVVASAAVEGTRQLGLLEQANGILGQVGATKTVMVPAIEAVGWAWKHAFWVAVILGGIWVWTKGRQGLMARLKAHVSGLNLWR